MSEKTPTKVALVARQDLPGIRREDGRPVMKGEPFEADPETARLARQYGWVDDPAPTRKAPAKGAAPE